MRRFALNPSVLALLGLSISAPVRGQWLEQAFELQPGWNTIFLEVDPSPAAADDLFTGLPIESVWTPAPERLEGPPNCENPDNSDCVPPLNTSWWVWVPASDSPAVVRNLGVVRGGAVYLIKATETATFRVTGRPDPSLTHWRRGFNLVGFHVVDDPDAAPTFGAYLSGSPPHTGTLVFEVRSNGTLAAVPNPSTSRVAPGRGYWVRSTSDTVYDGPLEIDRGSLRGIDFGRDLSEHTLRLRNLSSVPKNVTLTHVSSADVPPASLPTSAGDVLLEYLQYQTGGIEDAFQWLELTSRSWTLGTATQPIGRRAIRLAARRAGLAPATIDADGAGSSYQGCLRITDSQGFERWLPVSAEVVGGVEGTVAAAGTNSVRAGLYFGQVSVHEVAWITAGAPIWVGDPDDEQEFEDPTLQDNPDKDATRLRPAPAEFSFPVLLHLDKTGQYRLLTEVTLLWQPPDDASGTPARFVLKTPTCDPQVCDGLVAASIQDGQPFARRLSTAAFVLAGRDAQPDGELLLSNCQGGLPNELCGETILPAEHRLNPFRHRYHPDHDCDQAGECLEIRRAIQFSFAIEPPPGLDHPDWGEKMLGGTYSESIAGLHKDPIEVKGRFELRRVSSIDSINGN